MSFWNRSFYWQMGLVIVLKATVAAGAQWSAGPQRAPNGHYYEIIGYSDRALTWEQARIEAEARGMTGDAIEPGVH